MKTKIITLGQSASIPSQKGLIKQMRKKGYKLRSVVAQPFRPPLVDCGPIEAIPTLIFYFTK
jgi:hypothetical protein